MTRKGTSVAAVAEGCASTGRWKVKKMQHEGSMAPRNKRLAERINRKRKDRSEASTLIRGKLTNHAQRRETGRSLCSKKKGVDTPGGETRTSKTKIKGPIRTWGGRSGFSTQKSSLKKVHRKTEEKNI